METRILDSERSILLVITSQYPFGVGEEFFEAEIGYLAAEFKTVYVVSLSTELIQTRFPPSNVTVIRADSILNHNRSLFFAFIWVFIRHFFWVLREFIHEVRVIRSHYQSEVTLSRLKLFLTFSLNGLVIYRQLIRIIRAHSGVRFYMYSYWCYSAAYAVALIKHQYPHFVSLSRAHGYDLVFDQSAYDYIPLRFFIADSLDAIYFGSEIGRQYYQDKISIQKISFYISRLGVEAAPQLNQPSMDGVFRLVSCSYAIPLKRLELIVEALVALPDSFSIEWTHIGDGPMLQEIKERAFEAAYPKVSCRFLGHIVRSEVLLFYQTTPVDCFINVSSSEGVPVSIMEAFSYGIPVIATNVGGVCEMVNDQNGVLLPASPTPFEIAAAIQRVFNMSESDAHLRGSALETWRQMYDSKSNYTAFAQSIRQLGEVI